MGEPRYLVDITDIDALDVWGETVQARSSSVSMPAWPLVELAPDALVPGPPARPRAARDLPEGSDHVHGRRRDAELGPGGTWRIPSDLPHHAVAGPDGAVVIDIFSPVRADWVGAPPLRAATTLARVACPAETGRRGW